MGIEMQVETEMEMVLGNCDGLEDGDGGDGVGES